MLTYDNLSIAEATQIQKEMRQRIAIKPLQKAIKTIAGADISFNKFSTTVHAGIVVFNYPELTIKHIALAQAEATFPYVSGFLAFREIPALLKAWEMLPEKPDLLILDGQGITHPRKMGIATHFGILEDQVTIGCAKSMLHGEFEELGLEKGSTCPIVKKDQLLGYALRTKNAVKPIYISPGNLITADESLAIVQNCVGKYRIPEPTRIAHELVNLFRASQLEEGLQDENNELFTQFR
ncbi:MAG: deoxyribonuclease V [Flavobacterium sp.]|uniref:deoxyribonuclease V n=1 Tax=Flavobacterium sp. TaxID=239 RepID=UPI00120C9321|nr:deoxyribonuclease V [Flavobacterium sp.]RZJ67362.1 MAG: deoxyribonuclease V [Flavobacterium sp.]